MGIFSIASKILSPILGIVDKAVTDKDLATRLKADIQAQGLDLIGKELEAQTGIIIAEANGSSWLQRTWRPITMLFLVSCVGAHWFGFTPANLTPQETIALLDIVKIGLGGYVVGRSGEKIMEAYKK